MNPPLAWRSLLAVAVAALLLGILLAHSAFPPGADPGFMLALSYALEGAGPEGALAYPPALPGMMLVARRLAGENTSVLFWLVKAIGLGCLLVEAVGLAALAGALAGRAAFHCTFLLAAWNPNSWNQLLWGGYAQMLAVGLGGCALAILLTSKKRRPWLAGVFLGGVVLAHPYSAVFFGAAALCFALSRRVKRAWAAAAVAVVVALPAAPAYSVLLRGVSLDRSGEGLAVSLAEAAQNVVYHPAINLVMASLLVTAVVSGRQVLTYVWPFFVACAGLFLLTPPIHVARAGLFAWHGAVLLMGIAFAHAPASKLRLALVGAMPLVAFVELTTLVGDYAPLRRLHAEAMMTLASTAGGRTLVVSPTPNIDGWWYEGLTGKPALIGDDLRWSLLREQQDRSIAAQTIVHATEISDGGALQRLTLELPGEDPLTTLWARDSEYFPLVEERASDPAEVLVTPAPGTRCGSAARHGDAITLECEFLYDWFRWKGFKRLVTAEVSADGTWSMDSTPDGVRIRGRNVSLGLGVRGLPAATWRSRTVDELLSAWNVTHVWVRDVPEARRRFQLDPRFESEPQEGGVTVFRLR